MKKRQKLDRCLNCGRSLPSYENFCPDCGQENKDQKVPVGVFLEELITSLFSFDGKFFQTLGTFLLKPGALTLAFNSGQRKKYTHPVRLYLIFSLFYFFVIGFIVPNDIVDRLLSARELSTDSGNVQIDIQEKIPESVQKELKQIEEAAAAGVQANRPVASPESPDSAMQRLSWKEIRFLSIDPEVSEEVFSATLEKSSYAFDLGLTPEKRRAFIANSNLFVSQSVKNLPLMMLVLLPVFAFLIHVLYFKKDQYYIENLILGFHLHAFAYALYGLVILLNLSFGLQNNWLAEIAFILVTTYAYFAILRIFKQHWFRTLVKFWILGLGYLLVLLAGMGVELYFSLLLL
jgi:hypothetical protein